jgi:hypothetical protein
MNAPIGGGGGRRVARAAGEAADSAIFVLLDPVTRGDLRAMLLPMRTVVCA